MLLRTVSQSRSFDDELEHEAVLERTRGSLYATVNTSDIAQISVAGCVVEKQFVGAITSSPPDLWDSSVGDDYFMYQSFACVDGNATNRWNGREVDVKAKRRLERGSYIVWLASAVPINTSSVGNQIIHVGLNVRMLLKFN